MKRRGNHYQQQPLGICRRLFNFIMKNLVAQSFKRISYSPIASVKPQEVEFGLVDAHDEVVDSGGWIPVEVAKERRALLKTIAVEEDEDDDDDDDGYERVRDEESSSGKSVAIQEVHQHLHVDEHFEEFIKRTKKKIRKPSFNESSESDASKARDGSSK